MAPFPSRPGVCSRTACLSLEWELGEPANAGSSWVAPRGHYYHWYWGLLVPRIVFPLPGFLVFCVREKSSFRGRQRGARSPIDDGSTPRHTRPKRGCLLFHWCNSCCEVWCSGHYNLVLSVMSAALTIIRWPTGPPAGWPPPRLRQPPRRAGQPRAPGPPPPPRGAPPRRPPRPCCRCRRPPLRQPPPPRPPSLDRRSRRPPPPPPPRRPRRRPPRRPPTPRAASPAPRPSRPPPALIPTHPVRRGERSPSPRRHARNQARSARRRAPLIHTQAARLLLQGHLQQPRVIKVPG